MVKHLIVVLATVWCIGANASICVQAMPEDVAQNAGIAFVGSVTKVEESTYKPWGPCWERSEDKPSCGGKLVTFRVAEVLRGEVGSTVEVVSEDACYCNGQYWNVASSYLVVARKNVSEIPGELVASNTCSGTGPVGLRASEIDLLRTSD